jgi:hypothetical protein
LKKNVTAHSQNWLQLCNGNGGRDKEAKELALAPLWSCSVVERKVNFKRIINKQTDFALSLKINKRRLALTYFTNSRQWVSLAGVERHRKFTSRFYNNPGFVQDALLLVSNPVLKIIICPGKLAC